MAKFQASKKRAYKPPTKDKVGQPLIPSAAVEQEYRAEIYVLVLESLNLPGYVGDALTVNSMNILRRKAYRIATKFVDKVKRHSRTSIWSSLEKLSKAVTVGVVDVGDLAPQIRDNVDLITNLSTDAQEKLTKLYVEHGPDQSKIYPELKEMVGNRAKLISVDQNAKIFTSLNSERMDAAGIETFIWDHSSAGKTPRPCHVKRNGKEFLVKGGPAELYNVDGSDANNDDGCKKGDIGKPGYAIQCRCRMRPKVSLDD